MSSPGPGGVFLLSFGVALASMPVLMVLARRLGLVDRPDERKQHQGEVPLTGGLALLIALSIVLGLWFRPVPGVATLLAAGVLVAAAGLLDDWRGLTALQRFAVQAIATALMIFSAGVVLRDFGQLLWPGTLSLGWLSVPVTLFCVVGVTNAVNMIDGMDGLSGSIALVTVLALSAARVHAGLGLDSAPVLLALGGGLCGFLLFNLPFPWRKRAPVFMGDAGTLLLGFLLGWLLVDASQGGDRIIAPVTALWLLAVPLMDTVFVMLKRRREGVSMVEADREHLHHAFLRSGRSVAATLAIIVLAAGLLAAAGLALEWSGVPEYVSYAVFLALCGVYYVRMNRVWKTRRFLGRGIR
jgi:UDP-GlcNAc:undecaprenyl-phosphate GlcNAc-1-phosphate transferase